ncbi:MAG: hypothetical protein Q9218_001232 [Villophora microphyllina]
MATNVDAKLLKQTKFPSEFNQKVDMRKVNVEVLKKSMPRRPLRKLNVVPNKNEREIKTLIPYAIENAPSEVEGEEGVTGDATIMTDVQRERQGLLRLIAGDRHRTHLSIAGVHSATKLTRTSLATEAGDGTTAVVSHLLPNSPRSALQHGQERHRDVIGMKARDRGVADTAPAARQHPSAMALCEIKDEGLRADVVIVLGPIHLQICLAHDHPEAPVKGVALLFHSTALPLRQDHDIASTGVMTRHRNLFPEKRHKTADSSTEETNRQPLGAIGNDFGNIPASERRNEEVSQARTPDQKANVLREKLLREKVMALRKAGMNAKARDTDASS